MSLQRLVDCLLFGKPYFGAALFARQGMVERHRSFLPVVRAACEGSKSRIKVLEVGSWAGASAVSWASGLDAAGVEGEVLCVDPWEPYFDTAQDTEKIYVGMNEAARSGHIFKLFQHNIAASGFESRIHYNRGRARNILPTLPDCSFDLIYLDGSHRYEEVHFDVHEAMRLIVDGGIICGDDLELQRNELMDAEHAEALASSRDYVLSPSLNRSYHPGVTEAVAESFGAVSLWNGFWAIRKRGKIWEPIAFDVEYSPIPPHLSADIDDDTKYANRQAECRSVPAKMPAEPDQFRIPRDSERFTAVAKPLHHANFPGKSFGERDLGEGVLVGTDYRERPEAVPTVSAITETTEYRIVQAGERFLAVAKSLGPTELFQERLGDRELGDLLLSGSSLDDVQARVKQKVRLAARPVVRAVWDTNSYSLVQAGDKFLAVAKSLGPTELFGERLGDRELGDLILSGVSLDEVRTRAEERERKSTPPIVKKAGETNDYSIVQAGEKFLAVAKSLGPTDLFRERLGDRELGEILLSGSGLAEIRARAEEKERLAGLTPVKLTAETRDYSIVQAGAKFLAVAKSLGPTHLFGERLGERELGDVILSGESVEEVRARAEEHERAATHRVATLKESTRDYSILQAGEQFLAVAKSLGPIQIFGEWVGERELGDVLLRGTSLDDVRARVEQKERATTPPNVKLTDETRDYWIVQAGERFLAIAKLLGPTHVLRERLGERDLGNLVLCGAGLDEVRARATKLERAATPSPVHQTGETTSYSIVQAGEKFVAIAKALGPVDLFRERLGERELGDLLLSGSSLAEVSAKAEDRERATFSPPVRHADETRDYSIVQAGDRFLAIAKALGPTDVFAERLGERELGDLLLCGASLADVRTRAEAKEREVSFPLVTHTGETISYSLVQAGDQFLAVAKSLGPTDLFRERLGERELGDLVLSGSTFDEVNAKAEEKERAATLPIVKPTGETRDYSVVQADGQFFAVAKSLGPTMLFHERLGEREIGALILIGSSADEIRQRAEKAESGE